jgi:hypothetical protein
VCDDGLPFLLDLTNPAPGSILIGGDGDSGKTSLLRAILASAVYLNPPGQVGYYLVGERFEQFAPLEEGNHCQGRLKTGGMAVETTIDKLAMIAEARHRERPRDPALILAIDDLATLVDSLDDQAFTRLYWLIKHGPRAYIWTFATLPAENVERIHPRLLSAFRTRLVGHTIQRRLAQMLAGDENMDAKTLERGFQFCVPYGDAWLRFWLCEPTPATDDIEDSNPTGGDFEESATEDGIPRDDVFDENDLEDGDLASQEFEQEEM